MSVPTIPIEGNPSAPVSQSVMREAIDAALNSTAHKVQMLCGSTPDPDTIVIVSGLLRHVATYFGGALSVYAQTVSGQEWELFAGITIGIGGAALSYGAKRWAVWRTDQSAKASAAASAKATSIAGAPVAIAVQPG